LIHESSPPDYTLTGTLPSSTQSSISHTSRITSFQLHPSNPLQIITASEDGTVKVWSWTDGTLIRTLDVAEALHTQQKKGEDEEGKRGKIVRMAAGVEGGKVFVYAVVDAASRG
jgi:WD40 repeat protein